MARHTLLRVTVPAAVVSAAAVRATSEGRDVAAVVVELLAAYGAGADTSAAAPVAVSEPARKPARRRAGRGQPPAS